MVNCEYLNCIAYLKVKLTDKINTTKTGDDFENRSFEIINRVIQSGQLGSTAEYLRIFRKKGYYSHIRKKEIIFDLTIEVWPPGADRYVLLYVIECKSYKTRVPVNKVEDFHSKLTGLINVNIKGIFISNSPIQQGGYNHAESVGMMVIQGESVDNYKIVLHKSNRNLKNATLPILKHSINKDLLAGIGNLEIEIDNKIKSAFEQIYNEERVSYNIDKLSKKDIEFIANEELDIFNSRVLTEGFLYDFKSLIFYVKNKYRLNIDYASSKELLGSCDIKNNRIILNSSIRGSKRELFVFAHELGHYLLHQKLSIGQEPYDNFDDSKYSFSTNRHELKNPRHWIEWQANYFACSFILPEIPFRARVWHEQISLGLPKGSIYLDDQEKNITNFMRLVDRLSYLQNVSKTTIIYRLKELELINDKSRLRSIGQLMNKLFIDLTEDE